MNLGNCYENCMNALMDYKVLDVSFEEIGWDRGEVEICHGIVKGHGERHGHAWLECKTPKYWMQVCDVELSVHTGEVSVSPRFLYYHSAEVSGMDVVRYKRMDAIHTLLDAGHYGPWE